jgi:predicted metalloprotease with PDZ domain
MHFRMDADGETVIRLPDAYAGQSGLWRNVSELKLDGGEMAEGARPSERRITASPGTSVTLSYLVRSGVETPGGSGGQPFEPWIFADWLFIDGHTLFARPQRRPETPATFAWEGDPRTPFFSDLELMKTAAYGGTLTDIMSSTMLAGKDVRVVSRGSTRLALHGAFAFSDAELLDGIARILRTERAFWGDPADAPFLVTLAALPVDAGYRGAYGGTGHGDAFAAVISGELRKRDLMGGLFAHEIFHAWNPAELGVPATPVNTWFGEGFTEYYARLLPMRAGITSLDDFVDAWNEWLVDYMTSPARNYTGAKVEELYWSDPDAERMPYMRGALIAALWNRRLLEASGGRSGLDDLMRAMRREAAATAQTASAQRVTASTVLLAAARTAGVDLAPDMARFVEGGETVILPPDTFGPCIRVEQVEIPVYDRGFDIDASVAAGMVATGVRADGPAFRAGLRDGMRLVRPIAGRAGNATMMAEWLVQDGGQERRIQWLPAGAAKAPSQRLVRLPGTAGDAAACGLG